MGAEPEPEPEPDAHAMPAVAQSQAPGTDTDATRVAEAASTGVSGAARAVGPGANGSKRRTRKGWLPKPVSRILKLLLFGLVVEYLVLPQLAGTRKAIHLLGGVNPLYLLLGVALEIVAIMAYSQLSRAMLPKACEPGLWTMLRIQVTTLSVSHCVPGGTAAGSSLGYRMMTSTGVSGTDTAFALATQGLGSAVVLNALLWAALVISIPTTGFNPLYFTAAVIGAVLIGAFSLAVLLLTRGEERAAIMLTAVATRIPFLNEAAMAHLVHRLADRLRELGRDPRLLSRAVGWAAANWLLDAASLWVFVAAFGHYMNVDGLLVAYGLANVLAAIPITPGGLGVVETVLTSSLVGFGATRGVAILGVLGYRLVNFWAPIPIGGLAYLSLQVQPGTAGDVDTRKAARMERFVALRKTTEGMFGTSEDRRAWARRHGLRL